MHPILADPRRLVMYLLLWVPVAGLLVGLLGFTRVASWGDAALLAVPATLLYAFVCLGAFHVCQALPLRETSHTRLLSTHALAATMSASLWLAVARGWAEVLEPVRPQVARAFFSAVPVMLATGVLLFLLSGAVHYMMIALEQSRLAELSALRFEVLTREAELRSLRQQIHPHFLFNSLNSISSLTASDPKAAREVCLRLAEVLRRSLTFGSSEHVPLAEEVQLACDLLAVEKARFGSRLAHELRLDESARHCRVPPLLLQPLVENAVTHGISQLVDGGTIVIAARRLGDRLRLSVENPRDPAPAASRAGTGIGLQNVRRRLATIYGDAAHLRVLAEPAFFVVELELPVTDDEARATAAG